MEFSNGKQQKNVSTVGELIDELQRLPRSFTLDQGYDGNGVDVVIFNSERKNPHISFHEGGEWDKDFNG